jgi:hypothetical protein
MPRAGVTAAVARGAINVKLIRHTEKTQHQTTVPGRDVRSAKALRFLVQLKAV